MGFGYYNNFQNMPIANFNSWTPTYSWDGGMNFGGMFQGMPAVSSATASESNASAENTNTKSFARFDLNLARAKRELVKYRDKIYNKQEHEFRNSITQEGTAKGIKKISDKKWYQVLGRGAMNALNGTMLPFKQLLGFDKNNKWHWEKCLRNVGIGLLIGAASFIPVVGRFVAPTLGYMALAYGGYSIGKGAYNTYKAIKKDDLKAFDKATQDIGYGITTVLTAKAGLKANGSKLISGRISDYKATGTFKLRLGEGYRAAAAKSKTISTLTSQARANGTGAAKAYFSALKQVYKVDPAVKANTEFAKQRVNTIKSLNNRIAELDNKMVNASGEELRLLQTQKATLDTIQSQLRSAKTKADWDKITTLVSEGKNLSNENLGFWARNFKYRSNKKFYSRLNKEMLSLKQSRFKTMAQLEPYRNNINLGRKKMLDNFWGTDKVPFYQRYWQSFASGYNKASMTSPGFIAGKAMQGGFLVMDPIFALYGPSSAIRSNPLLSGVNVGLAAEHEFDPKTYYDKTTKEEFTPEEVQTRIQRVDNKYMEKVAKIAKKYNIEDATTLLTPEEQQMFAAQAAQAEQMAQAAQQAPAQQGFTAQA